MAYKGTLIKPDHVPLTWWEDPTTTDADREDAIDEAYNMKLHAEYIAAAEHEKYIDESEVNEWGPGGQPTAKKQLDVYKKSIKKNKKKNIGKGNPLPPEPPVLRYPYEGMTQHTDYLQIDIVQYKPPGSKEKVMKTLNPSKASLEWASKNPEKAKKMFPKGIKSRSVWTGKYNTTFKGALGSRANSSGSSVGGTRSYGLAVRPIKNEGTILLPIPSNVQDGNSVKVGDSSLNGLQAAGASAIMDTMKIDLSQDVGSQFSQIAGGFKSDVLKGTKEDDIKNMALSKLTASALGIFGGNVTTNQLFARSEGQIINPNMELLFDGPTLRAFKFQFKMTPRNEREAQQIQLIIRSFKRNMAPIAKGGTEKESAWFLKTPNVFELRYRTGNKDHKYLHRFKQCFLTDIAVNYTGDGVYSTYSDGSPVSYLMDLSFKELEPIYDIDYDSVEGKIGAGY